MHPHRLLKHDDMLPANLRRCLPTTTTASHLGGPAQPIKAWQTDKTARHTWTVSKYP
jgi:hypothetical protein